MVVSCNLWIFLIVIWFRSRWCIVRESFLLSWRSPCLEELRWSRNLCWIRIFLRRPSWLLSRSFFYFYIWHFIILWTNSISLWSYCWYIAAVRHPSSWSYVTYIRAFPSCAIFTSLGKRISAVWLIIWPFICLLYRLNHIFLCYLLTSKKITLFEIFEFYTLLRNACLFMESQSFFISPPDSLSIVGKFKIIFKSI